MFTLVLNIFSCFQIKLTLFDTSGHEEDAKVRALAYNQCDVIILCVPVDSPEALDRIHSEWAPEVRYLNKGKNFILVGTKQDLRETGQNLSTAKSGFLSQSKGKKTARKIGALTFFEFSAFGPDSVQVAKRIFGRAVREGLKYCR